MTARMCGVAAYLGNAQAAPLLLAALARQTALGRDSAGLALCGDGALAIRRALGPLPALAAGLAVAPAPGGCGIAHVRAATIGAATIANAHPHASADGRVAMVHAGTIANHAALRAALQSAGTAFHGDSDSEVIAHLIAGQRAAGDAPAAAVRAAVAQLAGNFAILALFADAPGTVIAVRQGSPLVAGRAGDGALMLASTVRALGPAARRVWFLPDGCLVELGAQGMAVTTLAGSPLALAPWRRASALAAVAARAAAQGARRVLRRLVPRLRQRC